MDEMFEKLSVIVDDIKRDGSHDSDVYVDAIVGVVKDLIDADAIKEALESDSNDAEHDALIWVTEVLDIKYTISED